MPRLRSMWKYAAVVGVVAVAAASAASTSTSATSSTLGAPQGVTAKTITFGFSSGLQGPYALAGKQEQEGILAAFKEANASGGINGRQLKLKSLNDNFDPTLGLTNFRNLATQIRTYGIVGSVFIVPSAIYQVAGQIGIPTFPLYGYPDPHLKNVFLLGSTTTAQSVGAVPVLANRFKGKKVRVGIVSGSTSAGVDSAVVNEIKKFKNLDLVSNQNNVPFTSTDMTPYVLAAKSAHAQALLMFAGSTQNLLFMQTAAQQSFKPLYIGSGGTMAESPMLTLPSCQRNCYRVTEFSASSPGYKTFAKWVKKVGGQPSDQGAENFAITETMIHILKLCGGNLSWSHFEAVAQKVKNFSTGGLYHGVTYGPLPDGHLGSPYTIKAEVINGKWKSVGHFVREPKTFDKAS